MDIMILVFFWTRIMPEWNRSNVIARTDIKNHFPVQQLYRQDWEVVSRTGVKRVSTCFIWYLSFWVLMAVPSNSTENVNILFKAKLESIAVECTVYSIDTSKKREGKFQTLSTATMVHFKQ
jgi:hypothetical protein